MFALQVSVLLTVFGFGLQTTTHEPSYLMRRPSLLVATFVVIPIVAVMLVRIFERRTHGFATV